MTVVQLKSNSDDQTLAYESAGVSSKNAHEGLSRLTAEITKTWQTQYPVLLDLGHFANIIEVGGQGIAFCTDGVGSKTLIAQMLDKYDTIGIDCVAMNVNDLICVGATPVSMVDYIALEKADASVLEQISIGLTQGALQAGISISGGEISQLPGIIEGYRPGSGFDLVGAAIGHVDLSHIITGKDARPGDVIIGVSSNGIHSNGLTLARNIFFEKLSLKSSHKLDELDQSIGEELLKPTYIYVQEALEIMRGVPGLKALVHVTSEGLFNLARLPATVRYVIDALPPIPPIFEIIQKVGRVSDKEMFSVYNMGVGFCFIVQDSSADAAIAVIKSHGKDAYRIGYLEASSERTVSIPARGLTVTKSRKIPNKTRSND
jgi:phosphoribosylformylglycinamidine cyclo-ligase